MQASVRYRVSFPNLNAHYLKVEITIDHPKGSELEWTMPVWTPGSYKVREFSRNVEQAAATDERGTSLQTVKLNKNTWKVTYSKNTGSVTFIYWVYAFELGVRTSYVDQYQAFINGAGVFMYAQGYQDQVCLISFDKPEQWKEITVALPEQKKGTYLAANYDLLADSPFALGNHEVIQFTAAGVPHRVAMLGEGNYEVSKIVTDFTKIIEKEFEMFGEHPSPEYVVFIQNVDNGGGGLEHLNSQTSVITRWGYGNESKYKSFLGLIAHEYFHLWNVKRIRPAELGPFDYNRENYTNMLWVAEGITSYYDDLFLKRCAFYKDEEYLGIIANAINKNENLPGSKVQSLALSSFDAWIKLYLPDENSDNSSISYYQKGMLVALFLDLEILKKTGGAKRLDDVLKYLYQTFYKKQNRGFTEKEFNEAVHKVCGVSMNEWLQRCVYTTQSPDYESALNYVGLTLKNTASNKLSMGITTKVEGGKTLVKFVEINRPASKAGISVNDEIIAINGYRVNGDPDDFALRFKENEAVSVLVSRMGKLQTLQLIPEKDASVNYKVVPLENPGDDQKKLYDIWLK